MVGGKLEHQAWPKPPQRVRAAGMRPDIKDDASGGHQPSNRRGECGVMLLRGRLEEMSNGAPDTRQRYGSICRAGRPSAPITARDEICRCPWTLFLMIPIRIWRS
jgi:hypothetical protein